MKLLNFFLTFCLVVSSVAYPLSWLYSQGNNDFLSVFPYIMASLWVGKALIPVDRFQRLFAIVMAFLLSVIAFRQQLNSMYWYPVFVNVAMLGLFGGSLFSPQPFIERLARLKTPNLSLQAVAYTRKVTQIWSVFFIFNIVVTSILIYQEAFEIWALFTGCISYLLMALIMLIEWLIRQQFITKGV